MLKKNDNQNFAFRDENTEVQSITESYRHLGPILLKSGQGGFIPKTFQGLHFFCFLGDLFGQQVIELFACETNLNKIRSVRML